MFQVWRCRKWASHSTVPAPNICNGTQGKWIISSSLEQQNAPATKFYLNLSVCVCVLSHSVMSDSLELQGLACLAPLSMGFSRQKKKKNWNGLPCPPPGDLPNPGLNPGFWHLLHSQTDSLQLCHLRSSKFETLRLISKLGFFNNLTYLFMIGNFQCQLGWAKGYLNRW